jgi:hypothetical protein
MSPWSAASPGLRVAEIDTPALVLDLDAFERNLVDRLLAGVGMAVGHEKAVEKLEQLPWHAETAEAIEQAVDGIGLALELFDLRSGADGALDDGEERAGHHGENGEGDDDFDEGEGGGAGSTDCGQWRTS